MKRSSSERRGALRLALLWPLSLLLLPLLLIGPSLLPGQRFLPFAPLQFEPLQSEYPEAAAQAAVGNNQWTADRLFPVLTDQLGFARAEAQGQSGAWEPHLGLGLSRYGNAIHGPDYPPNFLLQRLSGDQSAAPLAIFALFWPALGLVLFLRARGVALAAALLGALCLQAAGFGPRNLHYGMKVDAVAWLPWALLGIELWAQGRRWALILIGLAVGLPFAAGFPPIAVFAFFAAAGFLLLRLWPLGLRSLFWASAALALGPLLAAPQLLPTLAASQDSLRQMKNAAALQLEALPPTTALSLLVPDLFGSPLTTTPTYGPATAWWLSSSEDGDRTQLAQGLEWDAYGGALALLLALVGLLANPRRSLGPWLLILLSLGFAQAWPGVRWLYHLPVLAGGAPPRVLALAWIAWGWAAALGAESLILLRPRARPGARVLGLMAAALGLGLGLAPLPTERWTELTAERHGRPLAEAQQVIDPASTSASVTQIRRGGKVLGIAGLALLSAALLARRRTRGAVAQEPQIGTSVTSALASGQTALGLVGGAGVLALLPLSISLAVETHFFTREHAHSRSLGGLEIFPPSPSLELLQNTAQEGRLVRIAVDKSPDQAATLLARPNLPSAYGIRDLSAYVAFAPASMVETFAALDPASRFRTGFAALSPAADLNAPLLDAAQVRAVLSTAPLTHERLEALVERPGWCLYRRRCDLPAVRLVPHVVQHATREHLLQALVQGDWNPAESLHRLAAAEPGELPPFSAGQGELLVERPAPERFLITLPPGASGALVLSEQFERGWQARIDDVKATTFEADGCFLAVTVPAGSQRLELLYRAPGRRLGFGLAAAAALLLLLLPALTGRRARNDQALPVRPFPLPSA